MQGSTHELVAANRMDPGSQWERWLRALWDNCAKRTQNEPNRTHHKSAENCISDLPEGLGVIKPILKSFKTNPLSMLRAIAMREPAGSRAGQMRMGAWERRNMAWRQVVAGSLLVGMAAVAAHAGDLPELKVTDVGGVLLPAGEAGASSLSGLSFVGGEEWVAVSDNSGKLFRLAIWIDPVTGAITGAEVINGLSLDNATDLEGVAYDPVTKSVWVSDETGPAVRRHDLTTGAALQQLTLPAIYSTARANYSLESLTRDPITGSLWTANEEALPGDGQLSTTAAGSVVRLQRFDAEGAPAGQWAYVTEPIRATGLGQERSGVVDLAALPDGRLLVLERELAAALPPFVNRLYLVDFEGADDVSSLDGLDGQDYTPVSKTLLWEGMFLLQNFEGLGLGPQLEDGSFSLILISDDGGDFNVQQVYALRISGVLPEPAGLLPGMGVMGWALKRRRMK